jgi:hypothetical protein
LLLVGAACASAGPTPSAPAAAPTLPYVYKLKVAYVAETEPAEWVFVVEGVCFKSPDALRRGLPKLLKPAVIEFRTGGRQSPGQPLTTEAEINDLAAYCKSHGVEFKQIPGM